MYIMCYLCFIKQIFIFNMSNQLKYKVKEFMQASCLQLADVADYCRKDRQTVSNWCNIPLGSSKRIPRLAMRDLCEFFGCKPSDLITDTSDIAARVSLQNGNQIVKAVVS